MKMKVLVSVMTYPTLSERHIETVCTAGFKENGEWIRIYPVPHRLLYKYNYDKYKKWQWIEVDLEKNPNDDRPESFHIKNIDTLLIGDKVEKWGSRINWILKNKCIYDNMDILLEKTRKNEVSLAILKPTKVLDVICEEEDNEKHIQKLSKIKKIFESEKKQLNLFEDKQAYDISFQFAEKIPYKFKYEFITKDGKKRKLKIEDWEIGMLYRHCCKNDPPEVACQKVRDKYLDIAKRRDLYLFLGTTYQWQKKNAPDPYIIVGVFGPPKNSQMAFDF